MMKISTQRRLIPAFAVASLVLAACGRSEQDTAADNKQVDPAVAAADKRADELRADAGKAAQDMRAGAGTMANRAGDQVSDATITASVNAALAADPKLSAMKIDVDTDKGVVTLTGPAPDETARARATELAANAKGVTRVENQLTVKQ